MELFKLHSVSGQIYVYHRTYTDKVKINISSINNILKNLDMKTMNTKNKNNKIKLDTI